VTISYAKCTCTGDPYTLLGDDILSSMQVDTDRKTGYLRGGQASDITAQSARIIARTGRCNILVTGQPGSSSGFCTAAPVVGQTTATDYDDDDNPVVVSRDLCCCTYIPSFVRVQPMVPAVPFDLATFSLTPPFTVK
jgi:hypothetical protein